MWTDGYRLAVVADRLVFGDEAERQLVAEAGPQCLGNVGEGVDVGAALVDAVEHLVDAVPRFVGEERCQLGTGWVVAKDGRVTVRSTGHVDVGHGRSSE